MMNKRLLLMAVAVVGLMALLAASGSVAQTPDPGQPSAAQPDPDSGVKKYREAAAASSKASLTNRARFRGRAAP